MASKLQLRFISPGVAEEKVTIRTGVTYTFKNQRQGLRQVGIFDPYIGLQTHFAVASNFRNAFNTDDNYFWPLRRNIVTMYETTSDAAGVALPEGTSHWIVEIQNFANDFFTGFVNNTTFMTAVVTTTDQEVEPTLEIAMSAAGDACGKYKITVSTNQVEGVITIQHPIGSSDKTTIVLDGSLSYEVEHSRPTTASTGIVKLKNSILNNRSIKEIIFNPPPVLSISSVTVEGSPFGAIATINATSGLALEYSLNGVEWNQSKETGGLLAGNFTAYVRDAYGCQKTKEFIVTEAHATGLTAPELIEVPKHNALNFYHRRLDNFLGHLSEEITANAAIRDFQDYLTIDTVPTQFKSSYPLHTVKIFGCGTEEDIPVIQKSNNINRVNIYEGIYTEKEGRLAVYFTAGNIYNEDGTAKATGHILNGRLPLWYKSGMYLNIDGIGVTKIERILYEDDAAYAITQKDPAGTVANVKITSIHSEHPYEVYEFQVGFNRPVGNYIVSIDYEDGEYWTDVIRVHESLSNRYLKVKWWNNELNDQINYSTGIKPFRRLKYDRYFTFVGQNERETYDTDTSIKLLKSKSKALYELDLRPTSMEAARGLINGLNHASHIDINGAVFICSSSAKPENFGNWYFVKTELALIGQSLESIETDITQINVEFLKINDDADGVGFLQV